MAKVEVSFEGHLRTTTIQLEGSKTSPTAWVNVLETSAAEFTRLILVDTSSYKGLLLTDEDVQTLIDELQDHLDTKDRKEAGCSICGGRNH